MTTPNPVIPKRRILRTVLIAASLALLAAVCFALFARTDDFDPPEHFPVLTAEEIGSDPPPAPGTTERATFGSGCFWCTEAVFEQMKGVQAGESGYSGRH